MYKCITHTLHARAHLSSLEKSLCEQAHVRKTEWYLLVCAWMLVVCMLPFFTFGSYAYIKCKCHFCNCASYLFKIQNQAILEIKHTNRIPIQSTFVLFPCAHHTSSTIRGGKRQRIEYVYIAISYCSLVTHRMPTSGQVACHVDLSVKGTGGGKSHAS